MTFIGYITNEGMVKLMPKARITREIQKIISGNYEFQAYVMLKGDQPIKKFILYGRIILLEIMVDLKGK